VYLLDQGRRTLYARRVAGGMIHFSSRALASIAKNSSITDPALNSATICGEFHPMKSLRHTFASRLVMSGVNLKTVQELMGHKTIAMTARYAHLAPTHKL
jgi:site-specific recombinase XerD